MTHFEDEVRSDVSLLSKLDHEQRLDGQIVVTLLKVFQQDVLVQVGLFLHNEVHLGAEEVDFQHLIN